MAGEVLQLLWTEVSPVTTEDAQRVDVDGARMPPLVLLAAARTERKATLELTRGDVRLATG